jgi:hypothetical protein
VHLSGEEREQLENVLRKGGANVRQIRRAHTLLLSDAGKTDEEIANLLHITTVTVAETRKCWCADRLSRNLVDRPKPGRKRKLDGKPRGVLGCSGVAVMLPKDENAGRCGCCRVSCWS